MTKVPLLNEQADVEISQMLIKVAENRIKKHEDLLLNTLLDRESYLKVFAAKEESVALHNILKSSYLNAVRK